eukprot:1173323-Prorocentrum_minimum.AAC.1
MSVASPAAGALPADGAAVYIQVGNVWDVEANASQLMDLAWITSSRIKLRTLGVDYQYVRQSLPDGRGYIHTFENVLEEERLNLDYPFGALVEDIQLEFASAAAMYRLMGVAQRE